MSAAIYTPGPWTVIREKDDWNGQSGTMFVTHIGPFHIEWHDILSENNPDRIEADIALASAAPDLLKALKGVMLVADRQTDEFDAARAAIAKAEGGAK